MNKKLEKVLVLLIDFITINLSFVVFFGLRVKTGWFSFVIEPEFLLPMFVVYLYWLVIFTFVGMYRTWFASSRFDEISSLFKSTAIGIFILFFVILLDDYREGAASSARIFIFLYWLLLFLVVGFGRVLVRSIQRLLLIRGVGRRNAVIIGFNSKGQEVHDQLLHYKGLGFDVAAYVTAKPELVGKIYKGVIVQGLVDDLDKVVRKVNAKEVIIAIDRKNDDVLIEIMAKCENLNVGLKIIPHLYEILSGQAKTTQLYGIPLIDIMPQLMPEWEKKVKRMIDIVVAFIFLILTFPIILLTAIAIKLESKGPVLYKQERCGLNAEPFNILKFRSMRADAEKLSGPQWAQKKDPRITKVGNFIRKVRIDEIPQMINVLKGEMSLVGPRPERPYFVEKLAEEIPYYKRRMKVRPGITGWAQVKHKYDESIEDVKIKLRYDLFYIENISVRMDLKILFRTIFVVLFGKGQ